MPFAFPYKKERLPNGTEVFRPTIPIEMNYKGVSMKFVAIVDSGSDVSYIPQWANVIRWFATIANSIVLIVALLSAKDVAIQVVGLEDRTVESIAEFLLNAGTVEFVNLSAPFFILT